jgi:asparagine synthetase B (glutamine-hydrolysing)
MAPALRGAWEDADREALDTRSVHQILERAASTQMPSLLRFEDRNSMAHSIEGRVPYLDHRLVELAFSLAEDARLRGMQPKWVLRQAVADLLPREVLDRRDKIGFRADTGATRRFVRAHERERSAGRSRPAPVRAGRAVRRHQHLRAVPRLPASAAGRY